MNENDKQAEPVACIGTNGELLWLNKPNAVYSKAVPLYTHPAQPVQPTAAINEQLLGALKELTSTFEMFVQGMTVSEASVVGRNITSAKAAIEQAEAEKAETPYQIGQRLCRSESGISDIWGAVKSDADMAECQRGYDDEAEKAKGGV